MQPEAPMGDSGEDCRELARSTLERTVPAAMLAAASELLTQPLTNAETLQREVEEHLSKVERRAEDGPPGSIDVHLARAVAKRCKELLSGLDSSTPGHQRWMAQVAARYFTAETECPPGPDHYGFDEMELLTRAVADELESEIGGA